MFDERFDAKIDEAASEMTRGELPPDFRARVMARIESEHERRWTLKPAWVLAPLAVAAVILLAVFVVRSPWRSEGRVALVKSQVSGDIGLNSQRADPSPASGPAVHEPNTSRSLARIPQEPDTTFAAPPRSATFEGGRASDLAPASIEIASLDVEAMESAEIEPLSVDAMESIDLPRLDVAPLEVPAIGE